MPAAVEPRAAATSRVPGRTNYDLLPVVAGWAAITAGAFGLAGWYGLRSPFADELAWAPVLTGHAPVTWGWLWSQHNEHRMVVPRLIYVGLMRASDYDFRVGTWYSVSILSALAAALCLAVRRWRGESRVSDLVFPLALLSWAHWLNLIWGFQLNFVTAVALTCLLWLLVAASGQRPSVAGAAAMTAVAALLVGCGAYGLTYVAVVAGWLGVVAIGRWREGERRGRLEGAVILGMSALLAGLVVFYFVGLTRPVKHVDASLWARLRTTLEFFANALGRAGKEAWPISGVLTVGIAVGCLGWLARVFRERADERLRAAGLAAMLVGLLGLAAAIGWGRAFLGPAAGFTERYALLAAPLVVAVYLQSVLYAGRWSRAVQRALFVVLCVTFLVNGRKGLRDCRSIVARIGAFEADVRSGIPIEILNARHCAGENLAVLAALREAQLGPFREGGKVALSDVGGGPRR